MNMARNWSDGGYTVESMAKRARFDTRRVNVSQMSTQSDVLEGTELIIDGAPTSVEQLRAYKTSKRMVQISHATTARLHAAQLNEWHSRKAAQLKSTGSSAESHDGSFDARRAVSGTVTHH